MKIRKRKNALKRLQVRQAAYDAEVKRNGSYALANKRSGSMTK